MKKFIALLSCMLFILGSIGTVFADENTTVAGSCEFTGKEMVSSFDSNSSLCLTDGARRFCHIFR